MARSSSGERPEGGVGLLRFSPSACGSSCRSTNGAHTTRSLVATLYQGLTVGALVEGLPVAGGPYTGGDFGWLSPFALLCGVGFASATRCSAPAGW